MCSAERISFVSSKFLKGRVGQWQDLQWNFLIRLWWSIDQFCFFRLSLTLNISSAIKGYVWWLKARKTIKIKCQRSSLFRNVSKRNKIKENCDTIKDVSDVEDDEKEGRLYDDEKGTLWYCWLSCFTFSLAIIFSFISNGMTLIKRDNMVFPLHFFAFYRWVSSRLIAHEYSFFSSAFPSTLGSIVKMSAFIKETSQVTP